MPRIIVLAHQKGGVGKTTLALNIALVIREAGASVSLVDTDPQGSLTRLKDVLTLTVHPALKAADLRSLPDQYVIVDTPPYLSEHLPGLFEAADIVLIPTKAGYMDAAAIRATVQMTRKHAKAARIVLSMVKPNTSLTEEVRAILEAYSVPILDTTIYDRVAYTRSPDTERLSDPKAEAEILNLTEEVINILNNG